MGDQRTPGGRRPRTHVHAQAACDAVWDVFRLLPERVLVRAGKPAPSPDGLRRTHARDRWRCKALANDALPRPEARGVERRPLGGVRATPETWLSAGRGQGRSRLSVHVSFAAFPRFIFFLACLSFLYRLNLQAEVGATPHTIAESP